MKIKKGFIRRKVGDNDVVVAVGEAAANFNAMISLNGSASFLWSLLESETSEQELINAMLEKYDIDEATAKRDVEAFIDKASKAGVLDE